MNTSSKLRLSTKQTALLVIDIQEKLAAAMPDEALARVIKGAGLLARGMRVLGVPVAYSEQYPQGLGASVPELRALLADAPRIEKVEFDCTAAAGFALPAQARCVVLAG